MGTSVMKYIRASGCFLFRFLERKKNRNKKVCFYLILVVENVV